MAKNRPFLVATVAAIARWPLRQNWSEQAGFAESTALTGSIRFYVRYGMDILFWKGVSYETVACFRICVLDRLHGRPGDGPVWPLRRADALHLQPVPTAMPANDQVVAPSAYQTDAMPAVPATQSPATSDQPAPVPQAIADPGYQPSYLTTNQPQATAGTAGNGCEGCGVFSGLVNQFHQAACGEGCNGCCGGCCGCCGCGCDWYAQVLGLIMTRDRGNKLWTTYENGNQSNQIMNTQDAKVGWEGGGEIRFGRCFCCGQYAIEADFWALNEFSGYSSATSPVSATNPFGIVSTPLTTGLMLFNGFGTNGWFDNAEEHRLWRTDEVYNVELNMIRNHLLMAECGCPLSVDVLAGVRYFRFRENLTWGTFALAALGEKTAAPMKPTSAIRSPIT